MVGRCENHHGAPAGTAQHDGAALVRPRRRRQHRRAAAKPYDSSFCTLAPSVNYGPLVHINQDPRLVETTPPRKLLIVRSRVQKYVVVLFIDLPDGVFGYFLPIM